MTGIPLTPKEEKEFDAVFESMDKMLDGINCENVDKLVDLLNRANGEPQNDRNTGDSKSRKSTYKSDNARNIQKPEKKSHESDGNTGSGNYELGDYSLFT